MPYASGRVYCDADSHVMEPADWIIPFADPEIRPRLKPAPPWEFDNAKAREILEQRAADEAKEQRARGRLLATGTMAYGAWDATERSRALDMLGFSAQVVFHTYAVGAFVGSEDPDVLYGGALAQNRALAEFCSKDERLMAVGYLPMRDPPRAASLAKQAIELGCKGLLIDSYYHDISPTHAEYDPVWATMAEAGVPFMTHIGTGGPLVPKAFRNNGRPIPKDWLGGGENIRSKDYLGIGYWPYTFFSMMALDGVFERFPALRGASIEQGAEWVPQLLRALDHAQNLFIKTEPDLQSLPMPASDYIRRQVKFTPFPKEDVRWVTENVGPDLLMFSTDYPHLEGGHDPLKNFSTNLDGMSEDVLDKFYARNFCDLMGLDVGSLPQPVAA
jgi:predicted TIM-barrel fold metal-dependent hydrolase